MRRMNTNAVWTIADSTSKTLATVTCAAHAAVVVAALANFALDGLRVKCNGETVWLEGDDGHAEDDLDAAARKMASSAAAFAHARLSGGESRFRFER